MENNISNITVSVVWELYAFKGKKKIFNNQNAILTEARTSVGKIRFEKC